MDDFVKIYTDEDLEEHIMPRQGEVKLGQNIHLLLNENLKDGLAQSSAKFVVLGIPEDIGVRANLGKPGARRGWQSFLEKFLNIQSNQFLNGKEILLLGEINVSDLQEKAKKIKSRHEKEKDIQRLRELVTNVDERVSEILKYIFNLDKIPVIIGGGHNNAYPVMKAATDSFSILNKNTPVSVVNIDAHADLRSPEGRHSGNGFRYALEEGVLDNYFIFGLHQSYNNEEIIDFIKANERIEYVFFDDIIARKISFDAAVDKMIKFIGNKKFGLEIDTDSIENMPSSAITPSGFRLNEIRCLTWKLSNSKPLYLHLSETSPKHPAEDDITGKALTYLVVDFIKANL